MKRIYLYGSHHIGRCGGIALLITLMAMLSPLSHAQNANSTTPPPAGDKTWPSLSIGLQDAFLTQSLAKEGVMNNAWFISQYAYGIVQDRGPEGAIKNPEQDLQRFIDRSYDEIEASMSQYVSRNPQLARHTLATLIIDIEYPVHPRRMWKLLGGENHDQITPEFTGAVQAFARRYEITRKFFPKATLAAYGMGISDSQGRERDVEKWLLNAQILAAKMGMLEDVNAIAPVLYERFSPGDHAYRYTHRSTRQCLSNSLQIIQASHTPLDIFVLMSLTIFNANSENTKKPADLDGIADRLTYLHKLGVNRVIFWNGWEKLTGTNISVKQRFQQLRRLEVALKEKEQKAEDGKPENPPLEKAAPPAADSKKP